MANIASHSPDTPDLHIAPESRADHYTLGLRGALRMLYLNRLYKPQPDGTRDSIGGINHDSSISVGIAGLPQKASPAAMEEYILSLRGAERAQALEQLRTIVDRCYATRDVMYQLRLDVSDIPGVHSVTEDQPEVSTEVAAAS